MYLMVNALVMSSLLRMVTSEVIKGIVRTLDRTVSLLKGQIIHINVTNFVSGSFIIKL